MTTIKSAAILFTCLTAAFMYGGRVSAEPSTKTQELTAEVEHAAEAAASGTSCPGNLIQSVPVTSGSSTFGSLNIYFDSSTGNNCAMTVATGNAAGNASFIEVCLTRCKETSPGPSCTTDLIVCDPGAFHFFAGPVSVHAAGQCISANGEIVFNGVPARASLQGATHCF